MAPRSPPSNRSLEARRKFGVVNIDKPPGPSAHQVVAWVKDILDVERAGHAGTLDPKVTGCLPILLGDATRLAQALVTGWKEYVTVLELHDRPPDRLDTVLEEFEGEIYQKPPRKSAVARRLRTRTIDHLDAIELAERAALLKIRCESGTYIRKLCHDIGLVAGVGGHMGALRRTATEPFDDRSLVRMHDLVDAVEFAKDGNPERLDNMLQPAEAAVTHLPTVTITDGAAESVADGSPLFAPGVLAAHGIPEDDEEPVVACYTEDGSVVCLGRLVGSPEATEGLVVSLERVLV